NYVLVAHLSETTGNHTDSTQYGNNAVGTVVGKQGDTTIGRIGGADEFDSSQIHYINFSNSSTLNPANFTLEAWANQYSYNQYARIISKETTTTANPYGLEWNSANSVTICVKNSTGNEMCLQASGTPLNTWQYVVGIYNSTYISLWHNMITLTPVCVVTTCSPYTIPALTTSVIIGSNPTHQRNLTGKIDEIRISNIERSTNWINQTYQMVQNQNSFVTFGTNESYSPGAGWVNNSWVAFTSVCSPPYNDCWSNVTKTVNSTVGATIAWCVYANDTSNSWNSTSCITPFSYITTSQKAPSNCSMTAIPLSTEWSDPVDINMSYRNATDDAPITGATCQVMINSDPYNLLLLTYSSGDYTNTTTQLLPGSNNLSATCSDAAFSDCTADDTHHVSWSGEIDVPTLIIEDPTYSVNSSGIYHKIIKRAPPYLSGNLVTDIGLGNSGYDWVYGDWVYGMVIKPANSMPTCADIDKIVDPSKILLVENSSKIANVTSCPNITAFAGLIFSDDACVKNVVDCLNQVRYFVDPNRRGIPFIFNFTYNPSYDVPNKNNVNIFNLTNLTYVLLNGKKRVVQDISKLRTFYFNVYYLESRWAPSFLMRLYGQFGPSPYGIYSFVDMNLYTRPNSSVDYHYFNKTSNVPSYLIKGMPNCENFSICNSDSVGHFRLDDEISVLNSSGEYTHITSIGAEKLIFQLEPD
ncbi:MAG: LamG domain-containing protein, partial [Candidatus Micrarchaeota archaeon]|nr:LamG domain-containing protein [Candidatus Micrarchaeota archaeon]